MPLGSIGLYTRMSAIDVDLKTYSLNSALDDMSSPPSISTLSSVGSSTPASAGSTPSSIPSSGSTPYQFIIQEEIGAKSFTPDRPMEHISVTPNTPDQPITPDPGGISSDAPVTPDQIVPRTPDTIVPQTPDINPQAFDGKGFIRSPEDNMDDKIFQGRKRQSLSCISTESAKYRDNAYVPCNEEQSVVSCANNNFGLVSNNGFSSNSDKLRLSPSAQFSKSKGWGNESAISLSRDKSESRVHHSKVHKKEKKPKKRKNKFEHYKSEITDTSANSIKIKIKRTTLPFSSNENIVCSSLPETEKCSKRRIKPRAKRKSDVSIDNKSVVLRNKKRKSAPGSFCGWGPVLPEVDGEPQSPWGCSLPEDLLFKCLLYATHEEGAVPLLLRTSRVCRLWHKISHRPLLWHSVDLATGHCKYRFRSEKKLLWLLEHRLREVTNLALDGWNEAVTPFIMKELSKFCPDISSLSLGSCHLLHNESLLPFLEPFKKLSRLDLTNILGSHKPSPRCAVGQLALSDLAVSMNDRLTHLILAGNTLSNVSAICNTLADNCHNLQVLDISGMTTVGRDCVLVNIEHFQKGCQKLKALRMANAHVRLSPVPMSDQASSPGFPELEELSIAVNDKEFIGMSDLELERILKNSTKLKLLDVRGCANITDSSLVRIPPFDLEHLFLSGGSIPKNYSDRLELVIQKWRRSLKRLDLSWTGNSDAIDSALFVIADGESNNLRHLELCGSPVTFHPISRILEKCSHLEYLNLTSCRALPRGVKRVYGASDILMLRNDIACGRYDEKPDVVDQD